MRAFRLYPEEKHWCSFTDYGAILSVVERLQAKKMLEFGPGYSTLALLEGGAHFIDCCEDDAHWFEVSRERLQLYTSDGTLAMFAYVWGEPLTIPNIDAGAGYYDLGIVDGPHDIEKRPAVIEYCLARCKAVLVPLETSHGLVLWKAVERLAKQYGRQIELIESGPLAGAFALMTA